MLKIEIAHYILPKILLRIINHAYSSIRYVVPMDSRAIMSDHRPMINISAHQDAESGCCIQLVIHPYSCILDTPDSIPVGKRSIGDKPLRFGKLHKAGAWLNVMIM